MKGEGEVKNHLLLIELNSFVICLKLPPFKILVLLFLFFRVDSVILNTSLHSCISRIK